jgi:cytochrome c peroxidase
VLAASLALGAGAAAGQTAAIDPAAVRAAAKASGIDSLRTVPVPPVGNRGQFLLPGPVARAAAIALGKALFWDQQVGSDGQACASCHFHAGADNRTRNQIDPGLLNASASRQTVFDPTRTSAGGPDYDLIAPDFPFHVLQDPLERNFGRRVVLFDSDDVVSSQGSFSATFQGVGLSLVPGLPVLFPAPSADYGASFVDPVFNILQPDARNVADNTRRVEPRNTPSVINAVFNYASFWDGRAHNLFNGVDNLGPLDPDAKVWVAGPLGLLGLIVKRQQVRLPNSSLASQAVAPPTANLEMAFFDRPFPLVGRKLLNVMPLSQQAVDPSDSVLGIYSTGLIGGKGLIVPYGELIELAFQPAYWNAPLFRTPEGYSLMEANFSLFFGIAVQTYEETLVSDQTPFDRFMEGDDSALDQGQLQGLAAFLNRGRNLDGTSRNPPEEDALIAAYARQGVAVGAGNCVSCHAGPELTRASVGAVSRGHLIQRADTPVLSGGIVTPGTADGLSDIGFSNIGVRPTPEDPGRGGTGGGYPLSFTRQALAGQTWLLPPGAALPCTRGVSCPGKVQVDGAFKIPGLRNIELTGPFLHNGGLSERADVFRFYVRQGDFSDRNIEQLDPEMAFVDMTAADAVIGLYQTSLTDPRVRDERAPFDHPAIDIPGGGTKGSPRTIRIPAVGSRGRSAKGLGPLKPFLQ